MAETSMRARLRLAQIAEATTGHKPRNPRVLSPALLEVARRLNTVGDADRRHVMAGFGDAAPPDPRPKARVIPFRGVGPSKAPSI